MNALTRLKRRTPLLDCPDSRAVGIGVSTSAGAEAAFRVNQLTISTVDRSTPLSDHLPSGLEATNGAGTIGAASL